MFSGFAKRFFGSANERFLKRFQPQIQAINDLESELTKLDDTALRDRTQSLRERVNNGETLDDVLVEAFATVREAAKRTLGQRHYDVQLLGGIILHRGMIAEMKTGEGKTLVATLPVCLNALLNEGVHVVTVNDYLAQRDAAWMGRIYRFLGLTVGCITHGMSDQERRAAYASDITYGANNEFGFDYLRDNMKFHMEEMTQRPFNYAIVDEVDSILIDEARTPLIISGPSEDSSELYRVIDPFIPKLKQEDYEKDEKSRSVSLTEDGVEHIETMLNGANMLKGHALYDMQNVSLVHHINQALRAHKLFERDKDYIVKDDKVIIIDEFTGRMMEGRRYSEGLHQALEAKEKVAIQVENQTLASVTYQNYFRLYPKIAGMTGTAMTEASEFADIYKLEVAEIPTHLPCVRKDADDEIYRSLKEKDKAILNLISDCHHRLQPVLVGTVSIERSEHLSKLLKKNKIPHNVLNARYHEKEAQIIAQAGMPGAVTIATNMAGRGTDIQLGGNVDMRIAAEIGPQPDPEKHQEDIKKIQADIAEHGKIARDAGGLFVVGTERHESRRIDNQLRGRSGRQGDPGSSKFFLSLEDDLMRIFGSERLDAMLTKLGIEEDEAIYHPWINKALEKAQQRVEARNFDIRKNLLKFDNVMNDQRKFIYGQRRDIMSAREVASMIESMRHDVIAVLAERAIPDKSYPEQWDTQSLAEGCRRILNLDLPVADWAQEEGIDRDAMEERIRQASDKSMAEKAATYGADVMRMAEKNFLLQIFDQTWKDHLLSLDHLRQGISLRAYGQRDPLNEYKHEAFGMFQDMLARLREHITGVLTHLEMRTAPPDQNAPFAHGEPATSKTNLSEPDPHNPASWGKVRRNGPCPCGSGKKYKHCHGNVAHSGGLR